MRGVLAARDRRFRPWKNGGGQTAEIAVAPPGAGFQDFDWRVSTAIVAQDGAFSAFPGCDRVLAVVEGGPMELEFGDRVHRLDAGGPALAFAGDLPCHARLLGPPVLDLNLMLRRPRAGRIARGPLPEGAAGLALLLEPAAGLARLDLVDLGIVEASVRDRLVGTMALLVTVRAVSISSSPFCPKLLRPARGR